MIFNWALFDDFHSMLLSSLQFILLTVKLIVLLLGILLQLLNLGKWLSLFCEELSL